MKFVNRHIKLFFYGYTVILILIAVLPINSSGSAINHTFIVSVRLDYLLHFAIFVPWVFLLVKITRLNSGNFALKMLGWLVIGVLFALVLEAVQYVLPYRAFNINDLLANGLGVVLGFVLMMFVLFKSPADNRKDNFTAKMR